MTRRVCIVASSGGHLAQLHCLDAWWARHERVWVTFDKPDAVSLLKDEPLRRQMGEAGRTRARIKFSAERMVQDTLRVYQRVAMHPHQEG